jgi:hypothetical protein
MEYEPSLALFQGFELYSEAKIWKPDRDPHQVEKSVPDPHQIKIRIRIPIPIRIRMISRIRIRIKVMHTY